MPANTVTFYWRILKMAVRQIRHSRIIIYSAALSYFTIFSLPAIILIVLKITTLVYPEEQVRTAILSEAGAIVGSDAAQQLISTIQDLGIYNPVWWITTLSILVLLFTSTTAFSVLQQALNDIFEVPKTHRKLRILKIFRQRLLSLGLIIGLSLVLIAMMMIETSLDFLGQNLPGWVTDFYEPASPIVAWLFPAILLMLFFAVMIKLLPRVSIHWRRVWFAAAFTAVFFLLGKLVISEYISTSRVASLYHAAGNLVVIMIWIFYSTFIFLFGTLLIKVRSTLLAEEMSRDKYSDQ